MSPVPTHIHHSVLPIIPSSSPKSVKGSSYPLVDINLAFGSINLVYTFDDALQVDVLLLALGHAAGRMRSVCGRYEASVNVDDGLLEHKIMLADQPIPFTHTLYSAQSDRPFPTLPGPAVVQAATVLAPFLDPLTNASPRPTERGYPALEDGGELLRVQYTVMEESSSLLRKSVLGISWGHIIGDADLACQFMAMLSTIYVHLLAFEPASRFSAESTAQLSLPTFTTDHITFPTPSLQIFDSRWLLQACCSPAEQSIKWYTEAFATSQEAITITLSESELREIKRRTQVGCMQGEWISTQDALSAWWVGMLRDVEPGRKVERIINTISYRTFHPGSSLLPIDLRHTVGNVVQMSGTAIPSGSTRSDTALHIRRNVELLKTSIADCAEWLSNAAHNYRKAHESRSPIYFLPDPLARRGEEVVINSNLKYDWLGGASFGFGRGRVAYHTSFGAVRFLRVFRPNPRSLQNLCDGPGAELSFNVLLGQKASVDRFVAIERASFADM